MKKILTVVVLLVIAALAIAASLNPKEEPQAGTIVPTEVPIQNVPSVEASIGLNEPFVFNATAITAWAVTQDSRCASDVQCIWAGKVVVALRVVSPSGTSSISEIEPGKTVTMPNVDITLNDVSPYPVSTHKIADDEYRFSFTFKRL